MNLPAAELSKRRTGLNRKSKFSSPAPDPTPLISCLMVSRGDFFPAHLAIECYRRQTYKNRELVIVCAQKDSAVSTLVSVLNDPTIRYVECAHRPLGELRNISVKEARGSLLCTWDDDDLYHPERLELQFNDLGEDPAANYLSRLLIWWPDRQLLGITSQRPWENSMLVRREALPRYPSLQSGEDAHVSSKIQRRHKTALSDRPGLYCYVIHSNNTCRLKHFENIFENASWVYSDYERELSYLSGDLPIKWYSDELRARASGSDGFHRESGVYQSLYVERKFGPEEVLIDGRRFNDCAFSGTDLVYRGGGLPFFDNCQFDDVKFSFDGSASNTLNFARQLRASGFWSDI
jgi:glycosyltransferase involved in cell wall biosynthesis